MAPASFIISTIFLSTIISLLELAAAQNCPCRENVAMNVHCSDSKLIQNEYLQHDNVARGLYGDCLPAVTEKYVSKNFYNPIDDNYLYFSSAKCFKWSTKRCSNQLEGRCSLRTQTKRATNLLMSNSDQSTATLVSPGFNRRRYLHRIFCLYNVSLNCPGRNVDITASERTMRFSSDQEDYLAFYINQTLHREKLWGDKILPSYRTRLPSNSFMAVFYTDVDSHNAGRFELQARCSDVAPTAGPATTEIGSGDTGTLIISGQ